MNGGALTEIQDTTTQTSGITGEELVIVVDDTAPADDVILAVKLANKVGQLQ